MAEGWSCPKCGGAHAPWLGSCPVEHETWTTTDICTTTDTCTHTEVRITCDGDVICKYCGVWLGKDARTAAEWMTHMRESQAFFDECEHKETWRGDGATFCNRCGKRMYSHAKWNS